MPSAPFKSGPLLLSLCVLNASFSRLCERYTAMRVAMLGGARTWIATASREPFQRYRATDSRELVRNRADPRARPERGPCADTERTGGTVARSRLDGDVIYIYIICLYVFWHGADSRPAVAIGRD